MHRIYVPLGPNIGNGIFTYMFGLLLHRETGFPLHIRGSGLAPFGVRGKSTLEQAFYRAGWKLAGVRNWRIRDPAEVSGSGSIRPRRSVITFEVSSTMRISYYRGIRREIDQILEGADIARGYGDEFLVAHVRLGDIAQGRHHNYSPLPISWYRHLAETTGRRLVFMGQLDDGYYCRSLRRHFPDAIFATPGAPHEDFNIIRASTHVAISVSTFAYLATWMSDRVRSIYMPIWGIFDPATRKDISLLPDGDARYSLYRFNFAKGDANADGNVLTDMGYEPFTRVA